MGRVAASSETTREVYERNATTYDAQRSRALFEARWLTRFTRCLPPGGRVLDLGCGAGDPIARWFRTEGFAVTGVDFSPAMLAIARARFPSGDWREADMRTLELGETFQGIVAWDSFFHLSPQEQRTCISHLSRHLAPRGSMLLTVGPESGEAFGKVGGEPIYHASLSPAEYAACLEDNGMRLTGFLAEDPDTDRHTVLMARKI